MMELTSLWSRRVTAFWKEAAIYWSYAARSGLSAFLLLFFIIGSYAYMKILQAIPADYPYWRVTTPLLAVVLAWTPIRTFLKPADQVFLMPAESKLGPYWLRCFIYSYMFQALCAGAVLLALWPLYTHTGGITGSSGPIPFPAVVLVLLGAKLLYLLDRFQESKLAFSRHRKLTALIRGCGAIVIAFSLLTQDMMETILLLLGFSAVTWGITTWLPKHSVPWDYWIRKEQEHLKVHYTFFSWFADVPKLPVKPASRTLLARYWDRLPFDKSETYRYLFGKTFLRSELYGIVLRILVIAVLMFLTVENAVAEPLIYAVATIMAAATLSSLDQHHRYSFWLELYPVPKSYRAMAITRTALLPLLILQAGMGAGILAFHDNRLTALAVIAGGLLYTFYYIYIRLSKRASAHED